MVNESLYLGLCFVIYHFTNAYAFPEHHAPVVKTNTEGSLSALQDDIALRNERSTNLSHVTGTARKIKMFLKNRHLQIFEDGTVNGTTDDNSIYSILKRTTVGVGKMKIQGIATCRYLCMDICGILYGSRQFLDECIFTEKMEQHHYNTYSSSKYSRENRTLYIALNHRGQPRKVVAKGSGKKLSHTRVLTITVSMDEHGNFPLRHHADMCAGTSSEIYRKIAADSGKEDHRTSSAQTCYKLPHKRKKRRKCSDNGQPNSKPCRKRQKKLHKKIDHTPLLQSCRANITGECQVNNNNNNNNSFVDVQTKADLSQQNVSVAKVELTEKTIS